MPGLHFGAGGGGVAVRGFGVREKGLTGLNKEGVLGGKVVGEINAREFKGGGGETEVKVRPSNPSIKDLPGNE